MRLAFMGTPDFAVPTFGELLAAGHEIAAVYTKAPAPRGRGRHLRKTPVHEFAEANGIEVRTPKNFKREEDIAAFCALGLDAAFVVAYGVILPPAVLQAPQYGCFNLHASLLPRWRGAAPIQRAIMAGDTETAAQIMQMEAGLDTGPVLLSETTPIRADDTSASLHERLSRIGAGLAPRVLAAVARGGLEPAEQACEGVLYADKISAQEARIDWARPADEIDAHIRGLSPFPGAWFEVPWGEDVKRVKALMSQVVDGAAVPGTVLKADDELVIACGQGAVALPRVQREGKAAQTADAFLRGAGLAPGVRVL